MGIAHIVWYIKIAAENNCKGWVKINNTKLEYDLKYSPSCLKKDIHNEKKFYKLVDLTVKKYGVNITLKFDECKSFFCQIASISKYLLEDEFFSETVMKKVVTHGLVVNLGNVNFEPEICKMLNQSKFDCQIPY